MAQIASVVFNDGQAAAQTFDPLRNNGSGASSFRNNSLGQDDLKNLLHLNTSTNSNGTRKGRMDFIYRKTQTVDGIMSVAGTANGSITVSVPSNFTSADKVDFYTQLMNAAQESLIRSVLEDGEVLF